MVSPWGPGDWARGQGCPGQRHGTTQGAAGRGNKEALRSARRQRELRVCFISVPCCPGVAVAPKWHGEGSLAAPNGAQHRCGCSGHGPLGRPVPMGHSGTDPARVGGASPKAPLLPDQESAPENGGCRKIAFFFPPESLSTALQHSPSWTRTHPQIQGDVLGDPLGHPCSPQLIPAPLSHPPHRPPPPPPAPPPHPLAPVGSFRTHPHGLRTPQRGSAP